MVLFNKQGKWFPPITRKPRNLAQLRTGISQSSLRAASIFLSPKTCAYSVGKDQPRSGLCQSSLNMHHTAFAGSAKPLALNSNATRTIWCNWCFLKCSLNTTAKYSTLSGFPQRNFKHLDGLNISPLKFCCGAREQRDTAKKSYSHVILSFLCRIDTKAHRYTIPQSE